MTFTTNGSAVVFTTSGTATSFTVTPAVTGFETSPTVTPGAHASTHGAGGADPITTLGTVTTTLGTVTTLVAGAATVTGKTVVAAGSASGPSIAPTGDTNTGIYFPAADQVGIATAGVQRVVVGDSGLGIGVAPEVDLHMRSSTAFSPYAIEQNTTNDANASYWAFRKERSGAVVQSGDALGNILFVGLDGAAWRNAASIQGAVDGTPGSSDMPGRLGFFTSADGSASLTERMRIDNAGLITGTGTSLGAWTSYVPTLTSDGTNPTLGTGSTAQGYYCKIGKTVHWRARIQFGTSGVAAGTGYYFVSLPVTSATYGTFLASFGHLIFADASTGKRYLGIANYNTTSQVSLQFQTDAGGASVVQYNDPMTWDTSDDIYIQGTYEAA